MTSLVNRDTQWVRRFHSSADCDMRLVCFPHAGGSASYYYQLSKLLAPGIEVLAIQYPGRQDRRAEGCVDRIPVLADRVAAALRGWDDAPFAFFGHSMGSIVAFEVACRLEQDPGRRAPSWLFASGYPAPSRIPSGTVHLRDDAGVAAELRRMGGTNTLWLEDEDMLAAILPAVRGDYKAIETHAPRTEPRLDCAITMLVGEHDPHTSLDDASAWREHTRGSFALEVFPGGHFYLDDQQPEVMGLVSGALRPGRPGAYAGEGAR
jgi:surfactin synthase thioesterase subunit